MTLKKYSKYVYYFSLSNLILFSYWLKSGIFSSNLNYYLYSRPGFEFFLGIILFFIIAIFLILTLENIRSRKFYFLYNITTFVIAIIILNEIREQIGIIVKPLEFNNLNHYLNILKNDKEKFKVNIQKKRDEYIYNFKNSSNLITQKILEN